MADQKKGRLQEGEVGGPKFCREQETGAGSLGDRAYAIALRESESVRGVKLMLRAMLASCYKKGANPK